MYIVEIFINKGVKSYKLKKSNIRELEEVKRVIIFFSSNQFISI